MHLKHNFQQPWQAIPGSSQEIFLASNCDVTGYWGTRGPGKTEVQLMKFRGIVGMGYGSFWKGIVFDREYKNLDEVVGRSKRLFYQYDDGAKWYSSKSDYKWTWPTGEELLVRAVDRDDDYWDYHGQEFPSINWNEIVKYPTPILFDSMFSINRSSFTPEKDTPDQRILDFHGNTICDRSKGILLPKIPLQMTVTGNPYGAGHNWCKMRFIDPAPYGRIVRNMVEVFNPQTQEEETVILSQISIFGNYRENIYLDPKYIARLASETNENIRKAWLEGSWDIVVGGALDDVWERSTHVIPRFRVPSNWHVDRAFDWGSSHPYSCGWFAEANGEEAKLSDGTTFCPPPGTLIQIAELYGSKKIGSNIGVKASAKDVSMAIIETEKKLLAEGWIGATPWRGPADNSIFAVNDPGTDSIGVIMQKQGVSWNESDKGKGSRVNGLQLMRDRLEASSRKEGPGLYFMENCRASIATIPVLPRDETKIDDVDTMAEDHAYDMARYRCLASGHRFVRSLNLKFPT